MGQQKFHHLFKSTVMPTTGDEESEEDFLDTEDELEGIPELTFDLEEELSSRGSTGRRLVEITLHKSKCKVSVGNLQ